MGQKETLQPKRHALATGGFLFTAVTRLAYVEQHRPRREDDRVGHRDDELPRSQPAQAAERQLRAVPDVPKEQRQNTKDLAALKCVSLAVTARQERQQCGTITVRDSDLRAHGLQNAELPRPGPKDGWINECLNLQHFDSSDTWSAYLYETHNYSSRLSAFV